MFPTICFVTEHPDAEQMNRELEQFCLAQETTHPRLQTGSIQGGYHSNRQIFDHDYPAIQQLKNLLIGNARSYLNEYWKQESTIPLASVENLSLQMTGWSVILRQGDISTAPYASRRALKWGLLCDHVRRGPGVPAWGGRSGTCGSTDSSQCCASPGAEKQRHVYAKSWRVDLVSKLVGAFCTAI